MLFLVAAVGISLVVHKLMNKYKITGRWALLVSIALAPTLMGLLAKFVFSKANLSRSQIGLAAAVLVLGIINPIFGIALGGLAILSSFDVIKSIPIVGTITVILDKILGAVGSVYGMINFAPKTTDNKLLLAKFA